jgi:hypothetical protein
VGGSGTSGYISKWNGSTSQTNSIIYDNGTNVGIGTTNLSGKLKVSNASVNSANICTVSQFCTYTPDGFSSNAVRALEINTPNGSDTLSVSYYTGGAGEYPNAMRFYSINSAGVRNSSNTPYIFRVQGSTTVSALWNNGGAYFSQNVGIGTTSPSTKLEVGNFLDAVTNKITVAARYEYEPEFNFRLGQSGTNLDWIGAVISSGDDGNYNGKILFKTANAGRDTPTTKMVIKANGNVGIGTTSPVSKLQVQGDIALANNGVIGQGSIYGNTSNSSFTTLKLYEASSGHTILNNQSYDIQLNTGGNTKLIVKNGGNVGIGTTSPTSKLDVNGSIAVDGKIALNDGGNSVYIGDDAGRVDDGTDNRNVGVGYQVLYNNTTGYNNTANGTYALVSNTTGISNVANGASALQNNTTGADNTANGYYALYSNTTGYRNTANGSLALFSNTTGANNTANGYYALYSNTTGISNVANGTYVLRSNTTHYVATQQEILTQQMVL